jgi:hypothetical protein
MGEAVVLPATWAEEDEDADVTDIIGGDIENKEEG